MCMELSEIQDLIKFVSKSGVTEVELEQKDFKIVIKSDPTVRTKRGAQKVEQQIIQAQVPVQPMQPVQPVQQVQPIPVAQPAVIPAAEPAAPTEKKDDAADESKYITVNSPMIGTFYRSSSPDKPPFISVGDEIAPGKVICIVEAMKLFNEIEAEISGKIVKVLVDDASPIEYDQPLFLVDPA